MATTPGYEDVDFQQTNRLLNLPNPISAREPHLSQQPSVRVYNNANLSVTSGTAVTFNSERWDTDNNHSTATNTSRLVCNTAGLYQIQGNVTWVQTTTPGWLEIALRVTSGGVATFIANDPRYHTGNNTRSPSNTVAATWPLLAGDYVEMVATFPSGAVILYGAAYSPEFMMVRVSL